MDKNVPIQRERYNISNKPLSQQQHSLFTTLNTTSQQLQQAQQAITTFNIAQAPTVNIVDERYLSVFMRITCWADLLLYMVISVNRYGL